MFFLAAAAPSLIDEPTRKDQIKLPRDKWSIYSHSLPDFNADIQIQ